jgi:hypothetical protein
MSRPRTTRPAKAGPGLRTWLILIGAAANRQTLRDGEVAARAGIRSGRAIARTLERIAAFCGANRLPPLQALVVDATGRAHSDESGAAREAVFDFDWYAVRPPVDEELDAALMAETKVTLVRDRARPGGTSRPGGGQQPSRARRVTARVHRRGEVPKEEQTGNIGDDEAAAAELVTELPARSGPVRAGAVRTTAAPTWRVAKCLLALRDQVNRRSPQRNRKSDGTIGDAAHQSRKSDHNPWVREGEIGVVTALDITHDPMGGCDAGLLAEAIRSSRDSRVKYIIWNRQIANAAAINGVAPWTWRPYTGVNPHDKHVHISVQPDKAAYDLTTDWVI